MLYLTGGTKERESEERRNETKKHKKENNDNNNYKTYISKTKAKPDNQLLNL